MKRYWWALISCLVIMPATEAQCEWISLSKSLQEVDIQRLSSDPRNPSLILVASDKRLYKSPDGGNSWKQVMSVRGAKNRIQFIYFDDAVRGRVYAATDKGIYRSDNYGEKWKLFFQGVGRDQNQVYTLGGWLRGEQKLMLAGTADGLFALDEETGSFKRLEFLPKTQVYSLLEINKSLFALTDQGIYKTSDGERWERVTMETRAETSETSLEQFDIEEMPTSAPFLNLAFVTNQNRLLCATDKGVLESSVKGDEWTYLKGQPFKKINSIAAGRDTFYAATDLGIYRLDPKLNRFEAMVEGLGSKEVSSLYFSQSGDYLLAGTRSGVFKYSHPELTYFIPMEIASRPSGAEFIKQFQHEPSIAEVQNAAIRYAEVHPSKIEAWRSAASRKALLPTLSFSRGVDSDENIDIDRGGTGDADKFISGPVEKSSDWSIGLNWNLGEIIWNDDQTSIDTRSRLLVELRDDMLSKVTHLYYQRRRLQIDMALSPKRDLSLEIENVIKLEELTAGIDALTGNFFSARLRQLESRQPPLKKEIVIKR